MVGKRPKRLTYGSSRRNDGFHASWLSCQSDGESTKRRIKPDRHQTLKLRYYIDPALFEIIADHVTRSSQPALMKVPITTPDSPDPLEAHPFNLITDHATRSSQPAPMEIPNIIPSSPDPIELIHDERLDDKMDVQEPTETPLVEPADTPRNQNETTNDEHLDDEMDIQKSTETLLAEPADTPRNQNETTNDIPYGPLGLPLHVEKHILQIALKKPRMVVPFYFTGCLELPDYLVTKPNVDVSLLLVNKQLHVEAADILYGQNAFQFFDPRVARWWFQHIGPSNVSRIRSAHFILDAFEHMNFFVREERLWHIFFTLLEPEQEFQEISISFERWTEEGLHWAADLDRDRIERARVGTVEALFRFRGLEKVDIIPGVFLNRKAARVLAEGMLLRKGTTSP